MATLILEDEEFKVLRTSNNYVVARKNLPHEYHAHFNKLDGAKTLIELFYKGTIPTHPYFYTAMQRVCTEEEWGKLTQSNKEKDRYFNSKNRKRRG